MKTTVITETTTVRTFTLQLNDDEVIHLEAALDSYINEQDKPAEWLGMYSSRYDRKIVGELHDAVEALREEIPDVD